MTKTTIVTHNGTFHLDEITAYAILDYLYPQNQLIRTRDQELINQTNITIDVGGIYDPEKNKYDHHQSTFNDTFCDKSEKIFCSVVLVNEAMMSQQFNDAIWFARESMD